MPIGDAAPEIAIVLAAVVVLLAAAFTPQRWQWLGAPLALAGLLIAATLCAGQLGEARMSFSGVWALDGASIGARLLILAATGLVVLLVPGWLATDRRHGEYYAMLLLSALGAMLMAGAADLLELVMGVLLSSITGYTLAAYHRDWALSVEAGMKYFLVGALANALLVLGVTLLFGLYGATGYADVAAAASSGPTQGIALAGLALVVVGIGFKLAAVPCVDGRCRRGRADAIGRVPHRRAEDRRGDRVGAAVGAVSGRGGRLAAAGRDAVGGDHDPR